MKLYSLTNCITYDATLISSLFFHNPFPFKKHLIHLGSQRRVVARKKSISAYLMKSFGNRSFGNEIELRRELKAPQ